MLLCESVLSIVSEALPARLSPLGPGAAAPWPFATVLVWGLRDHVCAACLLVVGEGHRVKGGEFLWVVLGTDQYGHALSRAIWRGNEKYCGCKLQPAVEQ